MRVGHILICHSVEPANLFASIPHEDDALWFVFFHGEDSELCKKVDALVRSRQGNFFPYMINRGLAKSWNDGIHLAIQAKCEAILLLNDDLFFYDSGYRAFLKIVQTVNATNENVSIITVNGRESGSSPLAGQIIAQSFACCALTASALERVGYFDENFRPAYFEDVDYARRARLLGMREHIEEQVLVEHQRSATMRKCEAIRKSWKDYFNDNRAYYERKWGGSDGKEIFDRPFGHAAFGNSIAYERRDAPYGKSFDRDGSLLRRRFGHRTPLWSGWLGRGLRST